VPDEGKVLICHYNLKEGGRKMRMKTVILIVIFCLVYVYAPAEEMDHLDMMNLYGDGYIGGDDGLEVRSIERCVKFVNLNEFPEIELLGYILTVQVQDTNEMYLIKQNECLTRGYKFNELEIYAVDKGYLNSIGGLKGLKELGRKRLNKPISEDSTTIYPKESLVGENILISASPIKPWQKSGSDNGTHLAAETIEYSIAGFSGDKLILYESKRISKFDSSIPDKIETFSKPKIKDLRLTIKRK
jgi:hypothetical protein